jgi:phage nucleotide-binding protein
MIVYANPGVGKTTLASTLPAEETLIITTEAGLGPLLGKGHSLLDVRKVSENQPDKPLDEIISDIYLQIRTQKHPFKNIVLDNISELENSLLHDYTRRRKKHSPELREYGDVSYKMKEFVTQFRDLEYQGINVFFMAWETQLDIKNSSGEVITLSVPMVGKKVSLPICGLVDAVAHLEVYEKTGVRWLRFGPSTQYLTKSQFQGINGEEADLPKVLAKLNGHDYKGETK